MPASPHFRRDGCFNSVWIAPSDVGWEPRRGPGSPPPFRFGRLGGLGSHVFPGAAGAQVRSIRAGSRREGAGQAGVPNDSPALQPGEVLARAPLPHYRWGRSPLASLGFEDLPRDGEAGLWGGPAGSATLPLAPSPLPAAGRLASFPCPLSHRYPPSRNPKNLPLRPQSC